MAPFNISGYVGQKSPPKAFARIWRPSYDDIRNEIRKITQLYATSLLLKILRSIIWVLAIRVEVSMDMQINQGNDKTLPPSYSSYNFKHSCFSLSLYITINIEIAYMRWLRLYHLLSLFCLLSLWCLKPICFISRKRWENSIYR